MPLPASRSKPYLELPPRDAAREDDCPRLEDVAAVEVHVPVRRVDPADRARDEDLGAEPQRLLERAGREVRTGHALREAEVVLDPGRGARLAAWRLALDHDGAQALGRAVHGCREPRGPGADDHRVVPRELRLEREPEQLRDPPELRPHDGLAANDADRGAILPGRQRPVPFRGGGGLLGPEPAERDLVALEKAS